jgi:hypothetical protein
MAAAWREQLGDGELGVGRVGRGQAVQVGQVTPLNVLVEDGAEGRGWAAVEMA